jgi:transcriptional regulator with XRE-family HTH domain
MAPTLGLVPRKKEPATEFGRRLVQLRQARGLTQVQLAAAIDSSQRVISHYETVAEYPTVQALVALARVLRVSTDELLGLKPPPRNAPAPPPPREERRLWRHLRVVARLPQRDQRAVLRLIDTAARAHRTA